MKKTAGDLLNRYLHLVLAFLPALLLIRLAEFLSLKYLHAVPSDTWIMELSGYLLDNLVFLSFALILLIPFFLVGWLSQKAASALFFGLFLLFALLSLSLVKYYTVTLVPLDQVIFYFTPQEILRIVVSSTRIDVGTLMAFLLVIVVPLTLYFLVRKSRAPGGLLTLFGVILLASPVLTLLVKPEQIRYSNDFEYFTRINKTEYLAGKIVLYETMKRNFNRNDQSFDAIVKRYHFENRELSYIDPQYPLLRADATPDNLRQYFAFRKEKPNVVVIIMESLSTSFCGDHPYYGSFMPFLDSLISRSLYWKNFLATSERTFNVLPAVLGSLPYSNEIFRYRSAPLHFSLIRYLKDNGYATHFFYGGDPSLGGYDRFMNNEGIDYILQYFGKEYNDQEIQKKLFEWGYFDGDLFRRSLEVLDSLNRNPRLDIYLTLSTHAPFITPDPARYEKIFQDRLRKIPLTPEQRQMALRQKNIFTTVLYTDNALREFFAAYRKRPEFANTIFFITGDHAMPELNHTYLNLLERFHVPLIIYSPMLKQPREFHSVSSHLDITPSILAMLKDQGFITTRPVCHWLGKGIDTTENFENDHAVSFIYNSRTQSEYVHGPYFLSNERLYRLVPDFRLSPVQDLVKSEQLKREQSDYLAITNRICDTVPMIPDELFLSGSFHEYPYFSAKPETLDHVTADEMYISFVKGHKIGEDFQFIELNLSVDIENKTRGSNRIPNVVFQVLDENLKNAAWFQCRLKEDSEKGNLKRMALKEYFDLSSVPDIRNKTLKIYLYNFNQETFFLNNLQLEMKGYKSAHP